ncbi:O-methyltransferase [Pseudonocardia sp. HH130630-07]|uniref:O-methyltransferase n=1 Tax=Pseudonocardia sp. HH130630-07 TaxID=1690815 RepID=UPI0018D32027|nr:O-methyltransferase [Pseudonocardia sp. HH130630-07]
MFPPREKLLDQILRDSLLANGLRPMQINDDAARVLQFLTTLHHPQRVVEIGTYIGYSAIHIARGMPPGGRLVSLEADTRLANLARDNLKKVGVADSVEVVTGPAADYLSELAPETLDMVFIDADKISYSLYLKLCFPLLRQGGLLVADDALPNGDFSSESPGDGGAGAVRSINAYNRSAAHSPRLLSAFIGTGNGLMVSYKLGDQLSKG